VAGGTDDLDASPTAQSDFVDDEGRPLLPESDEDVYADEDGVYAEPNRGNARDVDKERQEDTFGRHERLRRIPWTLREKAEAERWVRESRGEALRVEQHRKNRMEVEQERGERR